MSVSASAHLSISGPADPIETSGGEQVTVTFEVTNTENSTQQAIVTFNNSSLPSAWTISDVGGTDPNPADGFAVLATGDQVTFSDVNPNETVTATATIDVPSDAAIGEYDLTAELADGDGNPISTQSATIEVPNPLSLTAGDNVSAEPGESVDVAFEVTNDGSATTNATVQINESALPANLTVENVEGTDPSPQDGFAVIETGTEVAFSDIDAGETVTVTSTIAIPDTNESLGNYSVRADLRQSDTAIATDGVALTVENQQSVTDQYDEDGDGVEANELITAIDDFRTGNLTPGELLELIGSFRNN
jgi:uncharacterized membrane protein